ncbi:hypothetical protein F9789_1400 [Staphylococcus arlettae]|uniref:hypothetical protein n=1 Tax=Staphylococcus arlettae TaxID=29378 RepID=UPI00190C595F|nr:hypothetical protein [Staphylococcus arlettae]MBK3719500.1 hypothetical protein [Staphylococcus arlettae]
MATKNDEKPNVNEIFPVYIEVIQNMLEQNKGIQSQDSYQDRINALFEQLENGNLSVNEYDDVVNEIDDLRREKATNPNVNGRVVLNLPNGVNSIEELKKVTEKEDKKANEVVKSVEDENHKLKMKIDELQSKIELNNTYIGEINNYESINELVKPIINGDKTYYDSERFYSAFMWHKTIGLLSAKGKGKSVVKYPNFNDRAK